MSDEESLPDEVTWELNAPNLDQPDLPKPYKKHKLWQLILHQLDLVERIDCWERVHKSEGSCLTEFQKAERDMALQTALTLQLLETHERDIVALIKSKKRK